MTRPRPGSAATKRGSKLTHRIVPPSSARRGINTQKSDKVRLDRKRDRRTGIFRRTFGLLRAMVLTMFVIGGKVLMNCRIIGNVVFQDNDLVLSSLV